MPDAFARGPGGSIREWARRSGIPRGQLTEAVRDGALRSHSIGNRLFVTSQDFHEWLERQAMPSRRRELEAHLEHILDAESEGRSGASPSSANSEQDGPA